MDQFPIFLCVVFPAFRLQAIERKEVGLQGQPVVLYQRSRGSGTVVEVSPAAQQAGIQVGMSLVRARARAACLHEVEADSERDKKYLEEVAEAFFALSPIVSLAPPNGLFCDFKGLRVAWKGEGGILPRVQQLLSCWGLRGNGALTNSLSSAWAIASYSDQAWPEVRADEVQASLASLPIEALQLSSSVCMQLRDVGLHRIGDIQKCTLARLTRRYGTLGERIFHHARGEDERCLEPFRPDAPLEDEVEFLEWCYQLEPLLFSTKRILDGLQSRMMARGVVARRVEWELTTEDGSQKGDLVLPRPQRSAAVLNSILRERWSSLVLSSPIQKVVLKIGESTPGGEDLPDLLDRRITSGESLDQLLARIGAAVGAEHILSPRPAPTHRPEKGWTAVPFNPLPVRALATEQRVELEADARIRPTFLFPEPQPLKWVLRSHQLWIQAQGKKPQPVRFLSTPERLSGEWWVDGFERDYYRVGLKDGTVWWSYQERQSQGWFLHGIFD